MRNALDDNEAILLGELEPLYPLSKHEGWRNALRAFLTGDGSVKELPAYAANPSTPRSVPTQPRIATERASQPAPTLGTWLRDVAAKWAKDRNIPPRTVNKSNFSLGDSRSTCL
jgi:hypothetical protein